VRTTTVLGLEHFRATADGGVLAQFSKLPADPGMESMMALDDDRARAGEFGKRPHTPNDSNHI